MSCVLLGCRSVLASVRSWRKISICCGGARFYLAGIPRSWCDRRALIRERVAHAEASRSATNAGPARLRLLSIHVGGSSPQARCTLQPVRARAFLTVHRRFHHVRPRRRPDRDFCLRCPGCGLVGRRFFPTPLRRRIDGRSGGTVAVAVSAPLMFLALGRLRDTRVRFVRAAARHQVLVLLDGVLNLRMSSSRRFASRQWRWYFCAMYLPRRVTLALARRGDRLLTFTAARLPMWRRPNVAGLGRSPADSGGRSKLGVLPREPFRAAGPATRCTSYRSRAFLAVVCSWLREPSSWTSRVQAWMRGAA